jgi:hypothetical protein
MGFGGVRTRGFRFGAGFAGASAARSSAIGTVVRSRPMTTALVLSGSGSARRTNGSDPRRGFDDLGRNAFRDPLERRARRRDPVSQLERLAVRPHVARSRT